MEALETTSAVLAAAAIAAVLQLIKRGLGLAWPEAKRTSRKTALVGLIMESATLVLGAAAGLLGFVEKSGDLKTGLVAGLALSLTVGKTYDVLRKSKSVVKP